MTVTLFIIAIAIGFAILIWGADRFIEGAANIASNLGVAPLIVGLTIVGFGTSAPEMLVSGLAAWEGAPALGIGNAIGSNITNVGLVLGITILISPLIVNSKTLRREFPILAVVMLIALMLVVDLELSRIDGLILFVGFIAMLGGMTWLALRSSQEDPLKVEFEEEFAEPKLSTGKSVWFFMIGLVALLIGSKSLIWGAVGIAEMLGVSELIIGLTIVALGTSLPELAASISSVMKKEHDIAVGNIIGSNIFNLLAVLAMPGLISPSIVDSQLLWRDFSFMIVLTLALYLFSRFSPKATIKRWAGALLLVIYVSYTGILAYQSIYPPL